MGNSGTFKKGRIPWNKGLKGVNGTSSTRFAVSPNHTGDKHVCWTGGIQHMTIDCALVWTGNNTRVRRPKMVWEQTHGELPKGSIIYHIDGDKDNDNISNLEAITRAELLRRNRENRII